MDRTLILVKPDAFARNLTGEIIARFERKGLHLAELKLMTLDAAMARRHYAAIPRALVPDAYPTLRRIRELRTPLLVIHGDDDLIVPPAHARALFEAAPGPKRLCILENVGHNDLVSCAGETFAAEIVAWAENAIRRTAT